MDSGARKIDRLFNGMLDSLVDTPNEEPRPARTESPRSQPSSSPKVEPKDPRAQRHRVTPTQSPRPQPTSFPKIEPKVTPPPNTPPNTPAESSRPQPLPKREIKRELKREVKCEERNMVVLKPRGVAKNGKKQPIPLGNKLLNVRIGGESFMAHEDLLCSGSPYLKAKFQKTRKAVDGDCAVCQEDNRFVNWCKECGQNVHQDCMQQSVEKDKTCPICRAPWAKAPLLQNANLGELNAESFNMYVQWLYGRSLPVYEADGDDTNARCFRLISAHGLSDTLQDTGFQQAIRKELIEEAQDLDATVIAFAYKHTNGPCALRRFLIDLYVLQGNYDWFLDNSLPRIVLTDLAQTRSDKVKMQDGDTVWSFMAAAGHIEGEEEIWTGVEVGGGEK